MINIAFFGECMIEQSVNETFRFGGDSLNSALYLARVAPQKKLTASYITAIGQDTESLHLLQQWQEEQLNTSFVSQIPGRQLGRYSIVNNDQGERSFNYDRDDSAAKYYFSQKGSPLEVALLSKSIDYLYFTGISLAILSDHDCQHLLNLLTEFKKKGGRIIFDNNYRPILWQHRQPLYFYQQAMAIADIAFLTDEDEFALYGGSTIESILTRYPLSWINGGAELVIKQGDKPCIIRPVTKETVLVKVASPALSKDKIIDTCAAGDAFAAGYLAKRLLGDSIHTSAHFAHALAGRVIQYSGAIIASQHMNDLSPSR
jgi:2-dehydro-3-deoxygluconokinase